MSCDKSHHKQKVFDVPFLGSSYKIEYMCTFCAVGSWAPELNLGSESQGWPAWVSPSDWFSCPFLYSTYLSVVSSSLGAGAWPSGAALSHCWARPCCWPSLSFYELFANLSWFFPDLNITSSPHDNTKHHRRGVVGWQQVAGGWGGVESFFQHQK